MFMKLITCYLSIILTSLFFSCSQIEYSDSLPAIDSEFNFKLSEVDALKLIDTFMSTSHVCKSINSPLIKNTYYLKLSSNVQTRNSTSKDIAIYQVDLNNEEKGFALVSGDKRMPCIIAYSEKGEISDTLTNKGAAIMIKNAEDVFLESIEKTKGAVQYPEGTLLQRVGPLVNVRWGQESPYNDLMPTSSMFSDYYYNGKYPVGSVPVAIAQIMSCFKPTIVTNGTVINWNELTAQSYISANSPLLLKKQIALLMQYVSNGTKTIFIEGVGTSTAINDAISFLKQNGLSINNQQAMYTSEVIASLDKFQLVLATGSSQHGSSHCWILDGYQRNKSANIINTYVHANFGWSGIEDGYYLANTNNVSFDTEYSGNYNTNLKIYSQIRR